MDLSLLAFGDQGWGDELLQGAGTTVLLAVAAYALGNVVGFLGALAKLSAVAPLGWLASVYTTFFRGVPELVIIYLLFFGSTGMVMAVAGVFGYTGYIELSSFTIGTVAVGLISGAYSTEVYRGAMQTIPRGQIEAAIACGMSPRLVFFRVVMPQTLRIALPGQGNVWQLTLKDTALVSVTGLAELMRVSHVAAGSTRSPFLFYVTAAVLFLVMTSFSQAAFQRGERWAARGTRRA